MTHTQTDTTEAAIRDLALAIVRSRFTRGAAQRITAKEARGNSRAVTRDEYDAIAAEGHLMLMGMQRHRAPITGLDANWPAIVDKTYAEVQLPWGGATIDAHTGDAIESRADRYAITVKPDAAATVSVSEHASRDEFYLAMDTAREVFRPVLEYAGAYLGIFHDDATGRIDIDPVIVVDTLREVEAIGAVTFAIGGAYHFASGDGFWPPHVALDA